MRSNWRGARPDGCGAAQNIMLQQMDGREGADDGSNLQHVRVMAVDVAVLVLVSMSYW